jgi:starvation-inducible DNA-binding protein
MIESKTQESRHSTTSEKGSTGRSSAGIVKAENGSHQAQPLLANLGKEIQAYDTFIRLPNGLEEKVCRKSVEALNQILADTLTLRDMYKKHHWQVSGHTFYQLHLLFDSHYEAQATLVDSLAERVQMLGGVSIAMAADVAEATSIARPPRGREEPAVQISRLLQAHESILKEAHKAAHSANDAGDDGTADLLIGQVIRTNQQQVWFLAEHLAEAGCSRED